MLHILNQRLQKIMPIITPVSVLLGILFSNFLHPLAFLVPWLFAFMTFSGSLGSGFNELFRSITRPFPLLATLLILHVVMPIIAFGIGNLFFPGDDYVITGIVLGAVIPTGIMSFIWVSVYHGNIPLTLSVILIDTLLSPYIVPYSLSLLVGSKISIDAWAMSKGLFWMIVVPSLIGMSLFHLSKGRAKTTIAPNLAPFSKIGLGIVVAINSSVVAPYLKDVSWRLAGITGTVFIIASLGYIIGWMTAKICGWDRGTLVSMTFNGGMRNISAGAVLAVSYFPAPVAVPVIVGMLFQQLLASIYGLMLSKFADKRRETNSLSV